MSHAIGLFLSLSAEDECIGLRGFMARTVCVACEAG